MLPCPKLWCHIYMFYSPHNQHRMLNKGLEWTDDGNDFAALLVGLNLKMVRHFPRTSVSLTADAPL